MTEEAVLYRELFSFLSPQSGKGRPVPSSSIDLPRPLARGLVHFYELLRSDTLAAIDDDLADQIAQSLAIWFAQLWRQLRQNTRPEPATRWENHKDIEDPEAIVALLTAAWPESTDRWDRGLRAITAAPDDRIRDALLRTLLAEGDLLEEQRRNVLVERALRLVTTPLADHLNETIPGIREREVQITGTFHRPGVWNIFDPMWDEVDWPVFEPIAATADREPDLAAFAQRLVRGVEPPQERVVWREESETIVSHRDREAGYGSISRLGCSSSPQLALPSELALLAHPETEALFLRKQVEHAILALDPDRVERIVRRKTVNVWRQVHLPSRRGPIVVCVDTSGSMQGAPQEIAAATTLLIVREALRQRRPVDVFGVHDTLRSATFLQEEGDDDSLGGEGITARGPVRVAPGPVIDLESILSSAMPGGANISPALDEALHRVETRPHRGHDLVDLIVISDIQTPKIGPGHLNRLYHLQNDGWLRLHALTINTRPIHDPMNIFDYRWHYNPAEELDFREAPSSRRIGITSHDV